MNTLKAVEPPLACAPTKLLLFTSILLREVPTTLLRPLKKRAGQHIEFGYRPDLVTSRLVAPKNAELVSGFDDARGTMMEGASRCGSEPVFQK